MNNNRIFFPCLESLRGIAAIAVLLFHFQQGTIFTYIPFIAHGDIFVDFFFVLSGFVIAHVYQGKIQDKKGIILFLKKRLLRLYPLHFFILTLVAINSLIAPNFDFDFDKKIILLNQYLLIQVVPPLPFYFKALYFNHPSWSISAELWTYLIFLPLLLKPNKWLALAITVIAYSIIGFKMGTILDTDLKGDDYLLLRCIAGFSFGIVVYSWIHSILRTKKNIWYDYLLVISIMIAFLMLPMKSVGNNFLLEISLVILFGLLILRASSDQFAFKSLLERKGFIWIGKISYSIYLSHILVGFYVYRLTTLLLGEYVNHYFVQNTLPIIVLIVCIIFSSFTYQFIERRFRYIGK